MKRFHRIVFSLACLMLAPACGAAEFMVRTAAQDSQPKFIQAGAHIGGLCVDVLAAMARLDPALAFSPLAQFVPFPRIEYLLDTGDLDMFCGMAKTAERQGHFDFLEPPIYRTHAVFAARSDDSIDVRSFDDVRKLGAQGVVLVVSKTLYAEVVAAQPGLLYHDSATSATQNLKLLLLGRGRLVFHSDFALMDEIHRNHLDGQIKLLSAQFVPEGRYIVVSKKASPQLRERLAAVLDKLQKSGELARIYQRYKPH